MYTTMSLPASPLARTNAKPRSAAPALVRPLSLRPGEILRVVDGRRSRIRVTSGVVWVTEEDVLEDHVLARREAIVLERDGCTLAHAHRGARVVVEVPSGVVPPRALEVAPADGEPGRQIALGNRTLLGTAAVALEALDAVAAALAAARARIDAAFKAWSAPAPNRTEPRAPDVRPGGRASRLLRSRAARDPERRRHAAFDEWLTWRM